MGENSKIEWTHHTHNAWWGCTEVQSPGKPSACDHCYAREWAKRFGVGWGQGVPRRLASDKYFREPYKWDRKAKEKGVRERVFSLSMGDWADNEVPDEWRDRMFTVIRETPNLDWLLLTKRPQIAKSYLSKVEGWPWPNVWLGVTTETQETADLRIPILLSIPAVVRFISAEPLFSAISLGDYHIGWSRCPNCGNAHDPSSDHPLGSKRLCIYCTAEVEIDVEGLHLHWVIAGGESGPRARPGRLDWYRSLRDQCVTAGVAFHFKQFGEYGPIFTKPHEETACYNGTEMIGVGKKKAGRVLDGRTWDEYPKVPQYRKPEQAGPGAEGGEGDART
jgi:protein gp37